MEKTEKTQIILDWLYSIIGEQYVMCNVMYVSGCLFDDTPCSKCRLSKKSGKLQLEVVLPGASLLIDQEKFSNVTAKRKHFLEKEGSISIIYKTGFKRWYEIHIIPVQRVSIPETITQCSEYWNKSYNHIESLEEYDQR